MAEFTVFLKIKIENVPNKETFGLSDPYFTLTFKDELLYSSEVIDNKIDTLEWKEAAFDLPRQAFMQYLTFRVLDRDTIGKTTSLSSSTSVTRSDSMNMRSASTPGRKKKRKKSPSSQYWIRGFFKKCTSKPPQISRSRIPWLTR